MSCQSNCDPPRENTETVFLTDANIKTEAIEQEHYLVEGGTSFGDQTKFLYSLDDIKKEIITSHDDETEIEQTLETGIAYPENQLTQIIKEEPDPEFITADTPDIKPLLIAPKKSLKKPHKCSLCNKILCSYVFLEKHMQVHAREKTFECSVCYAKFDYSSILVRHMRTHTGERRFECNVCSIKFYFPHELRRHMVIHTGERNFRCSVCGKTFNRNSILESHMRSHTGERPFECPVCGKKYKEAAPRNIHVRTHTGEKTHKCDICSKLFNGSTALMLHKRIHTKIKISKTKRAGRNNSARRKKKSLQEIKNDNSLP